MKRLTFTKFGDKYQAGWFYRIATIERCIKKTGWMFTVQNNGKTLGGGFSPSLQEAKLCAEEVFFGGVK